MHSDVADGLRDTDIRFAAVAGGKYCLVEKPDLESDLNVVFADLFADL